MGVLLCGACLRAIACELFVDMADISEQIAAAKAEVEKLKEEIRRVRENLDDTNLRAFTKDLEPAPRCAIKVRRTLKGHLAKIYALHWSEDKHRIVSASQDGKLLVWDGLTTNKLHAIPLRSSWVMTVAYAPSGNFVACGGLDNICSVYNLKSKDMPIRACRELNAHTGYLSCCRFIDNKRIVTSSGDMTCVLWDLEKGEKLMEFAEHNGDVMSLSIAAGAEHFVSAGCDATARLWDMRTGKAQQTFTGHTGDINTVLYFPNNYAFGTGSDDYSCRLFDIRADRELVSYSDDVTHGVTSIAYSLSGRYMFAGYDNAQLRVWDTLKGEVLNELSGHRGRVSCLGTSHDGMALCTGGWDNFLKIWA